MGADSAEQLVARLVAHANPDGGFGYSDVGPSATEPTALAVLALGAFPANSALRTNAVDWLLTRQQPSGAFPVDAALVAPFWATSLALLALAVRFGDNSSHPELAGSINRATNWLLNDSGAPANVRTDAKQHDASLVGWSWVAGTHSWVEPTAYAVMALRAVGHGKHPRVSDGVRLILDRAIPSGGWNYGNSAVLGNTLRPFPETTGVALAALSDLKQHDAVKRASNFLKTELPRIRSPLALAWGLIGLTACGERPRDAESWLQESIEKGRRRRVNCFHDALLLLAAQPEAFPPRGVQ